MLLRILHALLVIWLAVTLAFVALRVLPGDAVRNQLARSGVGQGEIQAQREALGLTDPLLVQYVRYLSGLVRGDLGISLLNGQPVTELIGRQIQPTATLAVVALILAIVTGVGLGSIGAIGGTIGAAARFMIDISLSVPIYWTGTLMIYLFTVEIPLFSSGGAGRLSQLVLPVVTLAFHTSGAIARVTQTSIRDLRREGFVQVARAKGLTERYILLRHVLRAGLLPVISVAALQAGFLFGGVVITETLFTRPGLGRLLLDATLQQDYPVVQGVVLLSAVLYTLIHTAADLLYAVADPRIAVA